MNYGLVISWVIAFLSFSASMGFVVARDWRNALYFLFAGCITLTVVWRA